MENEFLDRAQLDEQEAAQKAKEKKVAEKAAKKAGKKKTGKSKKRTRPNAFVQILNGEFLSREFVTNNLNFIFFTFFLLLLIVAKGYFGKELTRDVNKTQKELDQVTSDLYEFKTRLKEETRRIRLKEQLEPQGLKETTNPTKVIRIKKAGENDE